jgi:hypothetical protein
MSVFEIAGTDIIYRLDSNYDPNSKDLYIKNDDFPKILNIFLDHK